jgi:hypothetical protein
MFKPAALFAVSALCFVSTACVSFTPQQKSQLSTVMVEVHPVTFSQYRAPVARQTSGGPAPMVVGADPGAAAVGGLLGALMVEGIGNAQDSMFNKSNGDAIARAPKTIPANLTLQIHKAVARKVGASNLFQGKVREKSPNRLTIDIDGFGYVRAGKNDGKVLMTPSFSGKLTITTGSGETILTQYVSGASTVARPLEDFANHQKLADQGFNDAIEALASQVFAILEMRK